MALFVYTARTKTGEKIEDIVEAADRRSAMLLISKMGQTPISIQEKSKVADKSKKGSWFQFSSSAKDKMKPRESLMFTTELSDLLASGMTLGNALNCLAKRRVDKGDDNIIAQLRDEIISGATFSDALAVHPKTFPELYVNMIQAGESSGALPEVLKRLVLHYERLQETKEKIIMALVYPLIVLFMGMGTVVFAMVAVIPQFEKVFSQMGAKLPAVTQLLIDMSASTKKYGVFMLIGIIAIVILINKFIKTEKGRLMWDKLKLKTPLIKGVIAAAIYSNFARTFATLLQNGVPVVKAIEILQKTVGNAVIANELKNAQNRIKDGSTISRPLAASGVFPIMMTDMLAVGEETGDLPSSLSHIAKRYEGELDHSLKIFTTALEPILIVVISVVVGFVAISILSAVFSLSSGMDM
jgi:type II secretory pathway component PulF